MGKEAKDKVEGEATKGLEGMQGKISKMDDTPQVPCVTQKGSKKLDLRNWLETWCRSQLLTLKGVEGSCWKLRD